MKKLGRFGLFLSLISLLMSASPSIRALGNSTAAPAEVLQPAQTQSDFDLMRKALEEAHGGLYRYSSKAEMESHHRVIGTLNSER